MAVLSGIKNIIPIGGKFGFFDGEEGFEKISGPNPFFGDVKETTGILYDLLKEAFPAKGTLNFQEPDKDKQEAYRKKDFYQKVEVERKSLESSNYRQSMEDLARMEVAGMSSTEKNVIEGLNADLKAEYTNNPYHINNIRRKKLEQIKQAKRQQEQQEIAASSKGRSLVNSLDAQEGQSMVSSSGAIASAG